MLAPRFVSPRLVVVVAGLVLAAVVGGIAGCRKAEPGRLVVAASIPPLAALARDVAGPDADVVLLVEAPPPAPQSVAVSDARPADRAKDARVLVLVGLGYDEALAALAPAAVAKQRVLRVGDRVPTLSRDDGTPNPFVWLDPQRMRLAAKALAEELARADSSHAAAYRQRAAALDARLGGLDEAVEKIASQGAGPACGSPALAYFRERYHLEGPGLAPLPGAEGGSAAAPPADIFGPVGGSMETYGTLLRSLAEACARRPR